MDTVWMMPVKVNQLSVSLRRFEMSCHIWSRTLESNQTTQIFSHAMTGTSPDQTHIIYVHKIFSQHNDPMTNTQTLCNHLERRCCYTATSLWLGVTTHLTEHSSLPDSSSPWNHFNPSLFHTPFSFNESHCYSEKGSYNPSESPLSPAEF